MSKIDRLDGEKGHYVVAENVTKEINTDFCKE